MAHGKLRCGQRRGCLSRPPKAERSYIGVDDAYCAAIHSRFAAADGPEAVPVSVGKVLGRGVFVLDGILYDAQVSHRREGDGFAPGGAPARRAQLAECRARLRSDAKARPKPAGDRRCHCQFPGLAASDGTRRPHRQGPLHQRLQGNQRRCRRAGAQMFWRHFLDRGRQAQGRRH